MVSKYLNVAVLSVLATYLLSLAAGVYAESVYDYLYTNPIELLDDRQTMKRARTDIEEGVRRNLYPWHKQRDGGKGVVAFSQGQTYGDSTFFFNAAENRAYLVDLRGKIIHQWNLDATALPDTPKRKNPDAWLPDAVWRAFLLPDGGVLSQYGGVVGGGVFVPKGIFKVDKDSKLIWQRQGGLHHDIALLPDGGILTFLQIPRTAPLPGAPSLKTPFAEDFIVMLDANGKEQKRFPILDMFAASPQGRLLEQLGTPDSPRREHGDLFHVNTIAPVTAAAAARNPALKEGDYLLSFRNFDLLAAVDLAQGRVTWASYGPWHGQHSPAFLADGSLIMFDNLGNLNGAGLSRVIDVDTTTGEILWDYGGDAENPVFSALSSSVDPLPNGNVLVTETNAGRVFEVTRDRKIVWDYRAPQRLDTPGGAKLIPNLLGGRRYRREDLKFVAQ